MTDDKNPKKPSERIREIAKRIKDSHPSTKFKKRPEMPQYVSAIVEYLDEAFEVVKK